MRYPNFAREKELIARGYKNIVGIDEVGRGAWAGPLVAVATQILNFKFQIFKPRVKDSKLLSEKTREILFEELSSKVIWSIGIVTHREIDRLGITEANFLVVRRALDNFQVRPDYLLLDRVNGFKHPLPFVLITGGDRKVLSIAIASILAKVTRDRLMRKYHQKYPAYHFHRHKGYGTALHQRCLKKHGPCEIHRKSYKPVLSLLAF